MRRGADGRRNTGEGGAVGHHLGERAGGKIARIVHVDFVIQAVARLIPFSRSRHAEHQPRIVECCQCRRISNVSDADCLRHVHGCSGVRRSQVPQLHEVVLSLHSAGPNPLPRAVMRTQKSIVHWTHGHARARRRSRRSVRARMRKVTQHFVVVHGQILQREPRPHRSVHRTLRGGDEPVRHHDGILVVRGADDNFAGGRRSQRTVTSGVDVDEALGGSTVVSGESGAIAHVSNGTKGAVAIREVKAAPGGMEGEGCYGGRELGGLAGSGRGRVGRQPGWLEQR
mmetsp:Transcript_22926/g.52523  ORF Transcript_22926/g.52523 Transcript_22926/m.52523 type:complete len:284 (+) Transcript_22926:705-1556(+)